MPFSGRGSGVSPLKPWQADVFAALVTAATLGLRLALDGQLKDRPTLIIFTVPIMLGAYLGGLRSGLLATVISYFGASYYLLPPFHSLRVASVVDRWDIFFVMLAGLVISALNESLHRARRRADLATRKKQTRGSFFALSQDVLCTLGFDGYFKDLNPAWEKVLGYTKAELLATPFIELVHPDDRQATLAEAEQVCGGKSLTAYENRYRCKDGSYRWFQWSVTPDVEDRVMYGVARDTTQRKQAEIIAIRLAAIVGSSHDAIIGKDLNGIVTSWNQGAEKMFGYAAEEMTGTSIKRLIPADRQDEENQILLNIRNGESVEHFETLRQTKDGRLINISVTASPIKDITGNVIGVSKVARDITERKLTEEARRTSEARYSTLFECAPDGIVIADADGIYLDANGSICGMLGYTRAELIGLPSSKIVDESEVQHIGPALSAIHTEPSYHREWKFRRKDGSGFHAEVIATRMPGGNVLAMIRDVTSRKQSEEALRDSKQRLIQAGALQNAIFNSANFSSIATDEKGVIQIFNVGAERMLGYTAADVLNKITPAEISDPLEVIARAQALSVELNATISPGFEALVFKASRGIEDIYELTYIRKDGTRFPAVVSVTALRDAQGGIIGYLLIGTDNTARKRAEEALLKAGALQSAIFSSANFSCMATDAKGLIQLFNVGAERMLGYAAEEVLNKMTPAELHDPHEVVARAKALSLELGTTITPGFEALAFKASRGIEDIYELTKVRKDGSRFPAVVSVTALRDAQDVIIGYLLIGTDNTARCQVEEVRKRFDQALQETNVKLEVAKSAAEKANLAKSEFLSSMSHELRTPLNAILGFAQLMESASPAPTGPQTRRIAQILQAGWYLLKLINEVLDLAGIESGKLSLSKETVSLSEVMAECRSMMEPQAQQRGIRMTFPQFDEAIFVSADRTRLKQIIINLVSNAIKYNREAGTVVVDCAGILPDRIRISVKDTGAGLPPEKLAQLFQPFNRLGQEAGSVAGTGIGLVVSRRLVELMGGVLGVESIVGVGSVFWCELESAEEPLAEVRNLGETLVQLDVSEDPLRRTLLYVEDNPANMELVAEIIARFPDMRLVTAVNGTLGIELARSLLPQVILMDINLPGISGIKALKILRDDPATAQIPVVALSANAMPRDIEKGLEAGFFRYLTKPIKIKEFRDTLNAALEFAEERAVQAA
jgi:PAS domain S-box-containing protein